MKVTVQIFNPNDMNYPHPDKMLLNDIPTSENCISLNGESFIVIHTLFYNWQEGSSYYKFEQKIKRNGVLNGSNTIIPPMSLPFLLLIGEVEFEEYEPQVLFKEIKLTPEKDELFNKYRDIPKVPYPYLRAYDLVEIKEEIFVCSQITVMENIEVKVDLSISPMTVTQFREDKNHFVRNLRR